MSEVGDEFEKNVFINCPFDPEYNFLLRPLLFTIESLGFAPKIASERSDGGELRLAKITGLIRQSRYSIHDLSRLQADRKGEFYRLNMPFELGVEYGARFFGDGPLREKRCLILGKAPHDHLRALSDIGGIDIKHHNGQPAQLVQQVRNWFVETGGVRRAPSPTVIWYQFIEFLAEFHKKRTAEGYASRDLEMMPVPEFIDFVREWLARTRRERRVPPQPRPGFPRTAAG
jgi:hypothetical protein